MHLSNAHDGSGCEIIGLDCGRIDVWLRNVHNGRIFVDGVGDGLTD
jgi:hypothetical protein